MKKLIFTLFILLMMPIFILTMDQKESRKTIKSIPNKSEQKKQRDACENWARFCVITGLHALNPRLFPGLQEYKK